MGGVNKMTTDNDRYCRTDFNGRVDPYKSKRDSRGPVGQVADACYENRKNASLLPFLRTNGSNETP